MLQASFYRPSHNESPRTNGKLLTKFYLFIQKNVRNPKYTACQKLGDFVITGGAYGRRCTSDTRIKKKN